MRLRSLHSWYQYIFCASILLYLESPQFSPQKILYKLYYINGIHGVYYSVWKSVRIRSYSGPHFPAFVLNTARYSLSHRIQSECGKLRTRITPNMDPFYAVLGRRKGFLLLIHVKDYAAHIQENTDLNPFNASVALI